LIAYVRHEVGMLLSNSYVLYDNSSLDAVIIDAGDDAWKVLETVQRRRLKVSGIYATHCHFDHVLAVDELRQALSCGFYIHPDDEEMLASMKERAKTFLGIEVPEPPKPDGFIEEGHSIQVGDLSLSVLHTPGHSEGSVCYEAGNLVFTGDTLFRRSIGRTDTPGGDSRKIVQSILDKLFVLPDNTKVLPGHGQSTTILEEKTLNPYVGEKGLFRKR